MYAAVSHLFRADYRGVLVFDCFGNRLGSFAPPPVRALLEATLADARTVVNFEVDQAILLKRDAGVVVFRASHGIVTAAYAAGDVDGRSAAALKAVHDTLAVAYGMAPAASAAEPVAVDDSDILAMETIDLVLPLSRRLPADFFDEIELDEEEGEPLSEAPVVSGLVVREGALADEGGFGPRRLRAEGA